MSTRACIAFIDKNHPDNALHVYKHCDGYPTGILHTIREATKYAWKMPRFEADEFAAAFVTAAKIGGGIEIAQRGGGVRLMPSGKWQDIFPGDIEYCYEVLAAQGELCVRVFETLPPAPRLRRKQIFYGTLDAVLLEVIGEQHEDRPAA